MLRAWQGEWRLEKLGSNIVLCFLFNKPCFTEKSSPKYQHKWPFKSCHCGKAIYIDIFCLVHWWIKVTLQKEINQLIRLIIVPSYMGSNIFRSHYFPLMVLLFYDGYQPGTQVSRDNQEGRTSELWTLYFQLTVSSRTRALRSLSLPGDVWGWDDGNIKVKGCPVSLPSRVFQAKSHIFFHSSPPLASPCSKQNLNFCLSGSVYVSVMKKKRNDFIITGCLSSTDDLGRFWLLDSGEMSLIMSSPSPAGDWESDSLSLLTRQNSTRHTNITSLLSLHSWAPTSVQPAPPYLTILEFPFK